MFKRDVTAHLLELTSHFGSLDDPRHPRGLRQRLVDIVTISVLAALCAAKTHALIHPCASSRSEWLKGCLRLPPGIPSQVTFERVFEIINPGWQRLFLDRLDQLPLEKLPEGEREVVALDGKTSRSSASPALAARHTVSVYSVQHARLLRAASVPGKTNEITVLPELIRVVAPVEAIITTDAVGGQKEVVAAIREIPQDDDLLALKGNHPILELDVHWLFATHDRDGWDGVDHSVFHGEERVHGRLERREGWLLHDLSVMERAGQWDGLRAVVRVRATRTIGDRRSVENRNDLTSLPDEAREALHAARQHLGIENGLHWLLDVVFRDDASKVKQRNARQNWVTLRHLAITVQRRKSSESASLESKRFRAALNSTYPDELTDFAGVLPDAVKSGRSWFPVPC
ncbi:ISAs1 family transposase [Deinococcus sp.]|uniref:ISAs1 family transposase n=1 Tax=Deinococcus sp. TaxID=47478 RepID=UPI002869B45E|nr:ISAs1 family transposase [Deinococcus sp.]